MKNDRKYSGVAAFSRLRGVMNAMCWLIVASIVRTAAVPRVLPWPVIATNTLPEGTRGKWHSRSAASVTNWCEAMMVPAFTLLLLSHGYVPPDQYVMSPRDGVEPLPTAAKCPTCQTSQCSGTSPSHSTPEGLRRTLGSRPRVTARWMMACFCSSSSLISFCLARMYRRIRRSAWSRKRTMAACSEKGGRGRTSRFS